MNKSIFAVMLLTLVLTVTLIHFTINADALLSSSTKVSSFTNPSTFGKTVRFQATVLPTNATGTVTFTIDGTAKPAITLSSGRATISISTLSVGTHQISAKYSGNAQVASSTSSTLTQTVNKANTVTSVTSSINPAMLGNAITFTGTINNNAATGTVTFMDNGTILGTKTVSSGAATFTASALALGSHVITAAYSGDTNFNPSNNNASPFVQMISTQSPSQPFLSDFFRGDVNQSSLITFFNKFTTTRDFVSPILNAQPSNYFQVHAGNATMTILSVAQADTTIARAKTNHISYMVYDLEPNVGADFTKYVNSTATVANKVHAAGLKMILEPRWLELESYGSQVAPYADYIIIQLPYPEYTLHGGYANWLAQHIPILRSSAGHPIIIGEQLLTISQSSGRINNYNPIDIEIGYNSTKNYIDFIQLFYFNATYTDNTNTTVTSDVIPYLTKFYKGIGIPGL